MGDRRFLFSLKVHGDLAFSLVFAVTIVTKQVPSEDLTLQTVLFLYSSGTLGARWRCSDGASAFSWSLFNWYLG